MSPQRRSSGGGRSSGGAGRQGQSQSRGRAQGQGQGQGGQGSQGSQGRGRGVGRGVGSSGGARVGRTSRSSSGAAGRSGSGSGDRPKPPPTRMRPGAKRPTPIPSSKRGQLGRKSSKAQQGVGGDQVEGRHAVRELLIAGKRKVREIWISGEAEQAPILDDIRELAEGERVQVREVSRTRFAAQARCEAPQGVLAFAAPIEETTLDDLIAGGSPFLVALDGVTDPGNLGAVLRSAEGAGVTGIVLPRHRAVHVTPAATKSAAGAVEHLPMAVVGGLPAALKTMRDAGVLVIGLDGAAERSLYELPPVDGPVCLVLGAEGRGLSRLVRERCDEVVSIPLSGRLASLNVSAAAALACFEIARRR